MNKVLLAITLPLLPASLFSLYKAVSTLIRTPQDREVIANLPLASLVLSALVVFSR